MKHVVAFFFACVLLVFAGIVIWSNRTALTIAHLSFAGGAIAIAFAIAIPTDFKDACQTVAAYVPLVRGGQPPGGAK